MGHKSNDVGEDEEGDKSIPLLPLRVQTELVDCPTQLNLCLDFHLYMTKAKRTQQGNLLFQVLPTLYGI